MTIAIGIRRADLVAPIKAEANRRIEVVMPEYTQRNVLAQGILAVTTYGADPAAWPPELQAVNTDAQAKWAQIVAIRTASNEIEAMTPIPADYTNDQYWPET